MEESHTSGRNDAGQRLMIGFTGTHFNDELRFAIDELKIGGIILFTRNIVSPEQIRQLCSQAQSYAAQCGLPPLFIAIDQEGGVVARLKPPFTQFDGNPSMRTTEDAFDFARTTAAELNTIGVNMNMAPVLDVAAPSGPSVMRERAFGNDPQWVATLGTIVIEELQRGGIMAVGKHFPGIGRTILDSHMDLPDLLIDIAQLEASDLIPFQAAVQCEVSSMMLSHIRYTKIDPHWPASLSTVITQQILRNKLAFKGLVLTDDLDMGAIAKHYTIEQIVSQCLASTVDIMLICHTGPNIKTAFKWIQESIRTSEDLSQKHVDAVQRILTAKAQYLKS